MAISLQLPRFYPVLDTASLSQHGLTAPNAAEALLQAGVTILQYRHKDHWTQFHFDEAQNVAALCRQVGCLFVLNDRADFAHLLGAALHIGQNDLPSPAVRKIVSADTIIGYSTHNRPQLVRGEEEPVDYLSLGPIFPTTSKEKPDPVLGIEAIARLRPLTRKPLVAIGGITLENAADVFTAGADSVAVISALFPADCTLPNLRERAEQWEKLVRQAR